MGALPKARSREFVTRHLDDELAASPVEEMIAMAALAMDQGDMALPRRPMASAGTDPTHSGAIAGLRRRILPPAILTRRANLAMAPENSTTRNAAARDAGTGGKIRALGDDTGALMEALAADRTIIRRVLTLRLFIMGR
ncbi:MAG: hypothetical protein CM15mP55_3910 [Hyphomicrobiales bacterium]|nr:MAG: hypothetical protein CM15mP55_3910 [Hyphomicrobiales bacterium]